jgi:hypothetical protein
MQSTLLEGGNVFKDADGNPRTQRINLADIEPTVRWLEGITQLSLLDNMLGSTGQKPTSGDLDLAVDSTKVDKDSLVSTLSGYITRAGQDPRDWIRKSGTAVHFLTPIGGRSGRGFVQTDFMFMPKPEFSKFILRQDPASEYKGATRNVLINSMAKSLGYKLNQIAGIADRATNQLITDDPDRIAKMLLHPGATKEDLGSVEKIMAALKNDPRRDAKLADFRDHMQRAGTPLDEGTTLYTEYNEISIMARLRDRIVNQGMEPLIESEQLQEQETAGVGGRAKGIEHLEDLVFRRGSAGVRQALEIIQHAAESPGSTTVKWDGKPAVIFGRKPATGEFVLTDGAGFEARGYDGLATSPDMMRQIQQSRGGDRAGLIAIYQQLWPMLESALPDNFRGYVKGDLLYTTTPPVQAGNYVFRPNTVEYRIPAKTTLGQKIGASNVGIAMHSMYADQGDARQPLSRVKFNAVPGLLLIEPIVSRGIDVDKQLVREIKQTLNSNAQVIDTLFNPAELRSQQITDLARLAVDYINYRIGTGNFDNLLSGFGQWLQSKVSPRKFRNIIEYLQSPATNTQAMAAAFTLFLQLHELKVKVLEQLDRQSPGNEGWVMATPAGYAKAVNRFDFTVANRARNNP